MLVKIEKSTQEEKEVINVFCPFDDKFVKAAGNISGKFDHSLKCWTFPARSDQKVRTLLIDIFGTDDSASSPKIDIRVTFTELYYANQNSIKLGGRLIARATSRDSGAKLGDDVDLISGWVNSGGSAKNWDTRTAEGSVYEIFNFEASQLDKIKALDYIEVEVIGGEAIDKTITLQDIRPEEPSVTNDENRMILTFTSLVVILDHENKSVDTTGSTLLLSQKEWLNAYSIFNEIGMRQGEAK